MDIADLARLVSPGLGGLVTLGILLIATGRLVPKSIVDKLLKQEHQRAEDFKAAYEVTGARGDKLLEQQDKLLTYAVTADATLQALRAAAERGRR